MLLAVRDDDRHSGGFEGREVALGPEYANSPWSDRFASVSESILRGRILPGWVVLTDDG